MVAAAAAALMISTIIMLAEISDWESGSNYSISLLSLLALFTFSDVFS